ncbi:MAG: C1 family peptidase [Clostridia bacterium]|nr:C1 family peptidase [Clostridia bacterium]
MIISKSEYERMNAVYASRPALRAAALAMGRQDLNEVIYDSAQGAKCSFVFNHELETLPVTNQKRSGRCWLFAALNLFRETAAKKLNADKFELSQNYIAYFDKLEKANYFLDSIMKTLDLYKDDRLVNYIVTTGIQDGGQWDMMANLVKKYGLVPKDAMPETHMSSSTHSINAAVNVKLRRAAAILRREHARGAGAEELEKIQRDTLTDIHNMLTAAFGCPPEKFDLEYRDKDKNFVRIEGLTPKTFWDEYIAFPFDEYVSLINSPTDDKPYDKAYTIRFLGNVVEGDPVCYLNTDMATIKKAVMQTIDSGESVWFGSDVGWFMDRETGALINDLNDYSPLFGGMEFKCSKEDKLDYRMSAMNHAMTITGYHEVNGTPVRWKIQNSWGDERGCKGYYMMNDEWFDEYVYQAVVKKSLLPGKLLDALKAEKQVLEPWDPMGTLAE